MWEGFWTIVVGAMMGGMILFFERVSGMENTTPSLMILFKGNRLTNRDSIPREPLQNYEEECAKNMEEGVPKTREQ